MSRYDLVKEYNFYTGKRACYMEKLTSNAKLRSEIESKMDVCIGYKNEIAAYEVLANFFDEFADINGERYSYNKKQEILSILNDLDSYINNKISSIQIKINYWDSKIKTYDKEHSEK